MTTRVVGDVAVRVGADVGPLRSGLQEGSRHVSRFGGNTGRSVAAIAGRLASVGVAAAAMAAALGVASRQAIQTAADIANLSRAANATPTEFQRMAAGARSVGIEADKMSDILRDFQDRIGDFIATGAGPMADFFENIAPQVGVTAEQFERLSGPQALQLYVDSLEAANVSQQQMTFYMEAMASDATLLLPLLRDNGSAMGELADEAQNLGAILSNETVAAGEELNLALTSLGEGIRGELNDALIEMGPLLLSAAEFALRLARAFNGLVTFVGDTYSAIEQLIDPYARLEAAHDEVIDAMADEIRQSQLLDAALEQGGRMSVEMARVKLQEAQARRENALAAIEEQRAIAMGSDAMAQVNQQIEAYGEALHSMAAPGSDGDQIAGRVREQYEALEQSLASALNRRNELFATDDELEEQVARTEENIARLQEALAGASGGVATIGGPTIEPIDREDDDGGGGGGGGGGAAPEGRDASFIDQLLGIDEEGMAATEERMAGALGRQREFMEEAQAALDEARERGLISQEEYNQLEQDLQQQHNREMYRLRMEQAGEALGATSQMFEAMAQVAGSGGERLLRISRIMSAAQAFVNTLAGAAEALRLPFPANIAAAAQVMSTGLGLVAAIKGTTPGGSHSKPGQAGRGVGGSTGGAAAIDTAQEAQANRPSVALTLIGDQGFSRAQIVQIAEALNDSGDEGQRLQIQGRR